jgi:hypothetical protein
MTWEEFVALHIPSPATISVEAYEGSGAYGDVYAAPVDVTPCVVEDTRRLVRVQTQDAAGAEQVSSTTVYAPLEATVPPGSRVTVPSGRVARVLAAARVEAHGLPLPEYLELSLE